MIAIVGFCVLCLAIGFWLGYKIGHQAGTEEEQKLWSGRWAEKQGYKFEQEEGE